jgi:hypothetical protein
LAEFLGDPRQHGVRPQPGVVQHLTLRRTNRFGVLLPTAVDSWLTLAYVILTKPGPKPQVQIGQFLANVQLDVATPR